MKIGVAMATDLCIPIDALTDPGADVLHSLHGHILSQLVGRAQLPSWTECVRDASNTEVKI